MTARIEHDLQGFDQTNGALSGQLVHLPHASQFGFKFDLLFGGIFRRFVEEECGQSADQEQKEFKNAAEERWGRRWRWFRVGHCSQNVTLFRIGCKMQSENETFEVLESFLVLSF